MSAKNYVLPKSSPWVVEIDGNRYVIPSTVCRLLLQLEKAAKRNKKEKKQ